MRPVSCRVRVVLACVGVAGLLASCASPNPQNPSDLLDALPSTTATPTPSVTPPPPTASAKATPATGGPLQRTRTTPDAGTAPGAIGPQWRPAGGDEFNAGALDTGKWGAYDSVGAFGNGLRRPSAISEGGGVMTITATSGNDASDNVSGGMADSFGQLYGRWEARFRTDVGAGYSGVVLLWPDSESTDDGEIDVAEVPSAARDRAVIVLHSGNGGGDQVGTNVPGRFDQWHTVAVEWEPTSITWYVDGRRRYTVTDRARIPSKPMHLALQLDQGPVTNWLVPPGPTTPPALRMQVDYVHAWSWAGAPAPADTTAANGSDGN